MSDQHCDKFGLWPDKNYETKIIKIMTEPNGLDGVSNSYTMGQGNYGNKLPKPEGEFHNSCGNHGINILYPTSHWSKCSASPLAMATAHTIVSNLLSSSSYSYLLTDCSANYYSMDDSELLVASVSTLGMCEIRCVTYL